VLDILAHCHEFHRFASGPRYAAELAALLGAALTGLYVAPALPLAPPKAASLALTREFLAFVTNDIECA